MTKQEAEWQHIMDAIRAAYFRTKQLGANSTHKINQDRCKRIEKAVLGTIETILNETNEKPDTND